LLFNLIIIIPSGIKIGLVISPTFKSFIFLIIISDIVSSLIQPTAPPESLVWLMLISFATF